MSASNTSAPVAVDVKAPAASSTAAEDDNKLVNYFAIGSMINNISLSLRDIFPVASKPAILHDWILVFKGSVGMGSVEEKKGGFLHGVVHTITCKQMLMLDKIESGYDRVSVTATYYDGSTGPATVYKMKSAMMTSAPDGNPSERYIDIITRGCKHFAVKQEWIDYLATVKVTPRAPRDQWKTFGDVPTDSEGKCKTMTVAELAQNDGRDGRPLFWSINHKVLKFVGDPKNCKIPYPVLQNMAGADKTLYFARVVYEPLFPIATCEADITPDLRAHVENSVIDFTGELFVPYAKLILEPTAAASKR